MKPGKLINDILDVSRLERGKLELAEHLFHLSQMMQDVLKVLRIRACHKGLEMSLDIQPDILPCYFGDPVRLRQILLNLIGNAIKFTEKGWIRISVDPWEEGEFLHFTVSDTGIGIALGLLDTIFDPFTQADSSTSRRYGGASLGTTISKKLTELMGGQIWAESEAGKGAAFHFTLKMKAFGQKPDARFTTSERGVSEERGQPPENGAEGETSPERQVDKARLTKLLSDMLEALGQ